MDALSQLAALFLENAEFVVPVIAIFSRMSVFVFMLPGLGEIGIPVRVRLSVAFLLTWMLVPMIAPTMDPTTLTLANSTLLILKESFYGFLLGFAFRVMVFGLQITGSVISQSMSLSQIFGEGITTEPNTTLSTMFMLAGITLAVTMDLHVMAIGIFVGSFQTFPLGTSPNSAETAYWIAQRFAGVFSFSIGLALPFMILNFVYNLILGFLNRAMPQLMVSFVGMPAITGAGIFLLVLSAGSILTIWVSEYNLAFAEYPGLVP